MGYKVVIVGCGAQGKVIATWASRDPEIDEVKICDINYEACEQLVKRLNTNKVLSYRVDANNVEELRDLAKDADILVNALIPRFNIKLMEVALKYGNNYVDLAFGPPYDTFQKQLVMEKNFKDQGLIALICVGTTPGLTNLLVSQAADEFDSIETVRIISYGDMEGSEKISTWSPETLLGDFSLEPLVYKDGEVRNVPLFSGKELYNFPEPFGSKQVVYHIHEEILMIPHFIDKGVKNIDFKMGSLDLGEIEAYIKSGMWSIEPINVKGVEITPRDMLLALIPPTPTFEEIEKFVQEGKIDAREIDVVEVHGRKNNKKMSFKYSVFPPTLLETQKIISGATNESYTTGTSAYVFLKMLGMKKIKRKGVISTGCFEKMVREEILNDLSKKKIKITEERISELN